MAEKIIRTPDKIAGATLECLLLSYNELTGRPIKMFPDRATAERRLEMAMLGAVDATAHAGVPKGTTVIIPKTAKELGQPLPLSEEEEEPQPRECKPDWDGMVKKLSDGEIAKDMAPPAAKPTKARAKFAKVRALTTGTSRLQAASVRNSVFQAIKAAGEPGITLDALDKKFPPTARGHIQKLLASGHVEGFDE